MYDISTDCNSSRFRFRARTHKQTDRKSQRERERENVLAESIESPTHAIQPTACVSNDVDNDDYDTVVSGRVGCGR